MPSAGTPVALAVAGFEPEIEVVVGAAVGAAVAAVELHMRNYDPG